MTADEYWNAAPALAAAYREANKLKLRQRHEFAWLQGLYIRSAIREVAAGFGKSSGRKPTYEKKPIDLGLDTEVEKEDKVRREREKIIASLTAWKKAFDEKQKAKSGETP